MNVASFVDTNVWLYARSRAETIKQPIAARLLDELWANRLGRTSHQVLNEYYINVTRLPLRPRSPADAWEDVALMMEWQPQPTNDQLLHAARAVELRYRFNWWDCLVVAAAQMQQCSVLLTEDLQHGMQLDGLRVHDPFVQGASDSSATSVAVAPRQRRTRKSRMKP
jgi:predicted nucleic acid-binding protein